jgi:hypothetical protein
MSEEKQNNVMDDFQEKMLREAELAEQQEQQEEYAQGESQEEIPHGFKGLYGTEVTEQDISLWKSQFPNDKIFSMMLQDELYIFKTLNRVEYKAIVARDDLNSVTREETIVRTCALYPVMNAKYMGESPAGNIATLAQYIMRVSGFDEPELIERLA